MKILFQPGRRGNHALTCMEGLVVVVILFFLVAMLLPVVYPGPERPVSKVRTELADIVNAINAYQTEYGRYPIPTNDEAAALGRKDDLTYGGPLLDAALKPGVVIPVNAEVVAILMDMQIFPNGTPSANNNHNLNPKQIKFLNAKLSGDNKSRGVGNDGVYRDPWGNPYIISMDLSGDGNCRDAFYRNHLVSGNSGTSGFYGLVNFSDTNGTSDAFEFHGKVMAWSLGPDGKADASKPANEAPNKDNILSWQ
ncbi:MAG TPA: hypothetical protein VK815_05490 [Candidatus Acidoferrales bacterium]|jgi:hypothetical protein|nr:hypothetical protein [Candidatus Acidoferrales bacterium]